MLISEMLVQRLQRCTSQPSHWSTAPSSGIDSQSAADYFCKLKGSVKEPNKFHDYETEKITRKASDAGEYIELFGSFTRDRHARCIIVHDDLG